MNKRIQTEIIIRASREQVWEVLTSFGQYGEWNPFIIQISGKLEQGQRLTNTMVSEGRKFVFRPRVLSVVPGHSLAWLGSLGVKGIFDGHHYFELTELEPGTVQLTHGEVFSGLLSGYILKKIGAATRNNFVAMNNAIRQRAEAMTPVPAGLMR